MFLPDEIVIDRFVPPENEGAKLDWKSIKIKFTK